jgi:hypothetical protein
MYKGGAISVSDARFGMTDGGDRRNETEKQRNGETVKRGDERTRR